MDKFHIIKNFLTEEECLGILTKYKAELKLKPAEVAVLVGNTFSNKRKSSIAFIDNIETIDERIKNTLKNTIQIKGFEVTGLGPYQFTEYKVGEHYDWHTDSSSIADEYKDRFCSIVIQINDEYEGGYLQLKDEDGDSIIQLNKGIGTMYIFYSNIVHRVVPVTDGVRYSLVNWISLRKLENFKKTLL
jgi:predicted 2-oxoglutarate/Fe(II)-dependent dioxygenase YbiX